MAKTPMPIAPIGARPSSTLSPDSRPAARLPMPMPIAANEVSTPTHVPLRAITSVPNRMTTSCRSEPRNQKYEMPITVSQSTRSRRRVTQPGPDLAPGIAVDPLAGGRRRDVRNAEAQRRSDDGDADHEDADDPQVGAHRFEQISANGGAEHDGHEGAHLEHAVRSRQVAVRQYFRQNPVLRRTEERRLQGDQEQDGVGELQVAEEKRHETQRGGDDLQRLADDQHRPLAVDVGELSGIPGEEQEREDEDGADDRQLTSGARGGSPSGPPASRRRS